MSDPGLQVRWQASASACSAELWEQCFPPPLEGRWWYEALERGGLEDQFRFLYAEVLDRNGRPCALAPAFLMDVPLEMFVPEPLVPIVRPLGRLFPSLLHQRTLFLGSPCSDCGWVGIYPTLDTAQRLAVLEAIDRAAARHARTLDAPMRVWKDFPASFRDALAELAARRGLFPVTSFPGTRVEFPGGDKEAYFRQIKPSRRQQLRRKLRRSRERVEVEVIRLTQPDAARLAPLFALFWQTYQRAETRFERLTPAVFEQLAAAPCVHFLVLRVPGAPDPLAFMMIYLQGSVMVNKFIGIDYRQPREWMPYFRLWDAAVDFALASGCSAIESGQTGYRAKIAVGHQPYPLWNWCHHRNPLRRALYAAVGKHVSWASLDDDLAELEGGADEAG